MNTIYKSISIIFLIAFLFNSCNNPEGNVQDSNLNDNTNYNKENLESESRPSTNKNNQFLKIKPLYKLEKCKECKKFHPKCADCSDKQWDMPIDLFIDGNKVISNNKLSLNFKDFSSYQPQRPNYSIPSYPAQAKAPVIYIYSDTERKCDINFDTNGGQVINLSYPAYDNKGWSFTCQRNKNGSLIFANKSILPYLYYTFTIPPNLLSKIKSNEGFIVQREKLIEFLPQKLRKLGLNDREITDFILYWYEKLSKFPSVFIQFLVDQQVDELLPMNVKFSGNQNYKKAERRIIMVYNDIIPKDHIEQKLDSIQTLDRSKYNINIIEWGGFRMPQPRKSKL
ncbi:MAG: hypothetical protein GY830_06250 [Bacteroidetes bacterium]|nr:hypothetical protein [Bacteroidota bacterium]